MRQGKLGAAARTLLPWLIATQALILGAVIVMTIGYTRLSKSQTARQIALSLRNSLIADEFRDAMIMASAAVPVSFDAIIFEKNHVPVFTIPHGARGPGEGGPRYWHESVDLNFSMDPSAESNFGKLIFVADSFELVDHAVLIWLFFALVSVPVYVFAYKYLKKKHAADLAIKKDLAIAQTTQMLAHDVRKPFSLLKMSVGMLQSAKGPEDVASLLSFIVPEVDRAVVKVEGLIADVMEMGSPVANVVSETANVELLFSTCLDEIFHVYPKANVRVSRKFDHTHQVLVNVHKIGRVLSNILDNAFQAIECDGDIWIKTREREGVIELCIGNAQSYIPKEDTSNVFDIFYTKGKTSGTGLGLAIAKKVVLSHGGQIWCKSERSDEYPDGMVEFWFSLPVAPTTSR